MLDAGLLRYFADTNKPFLMEATQRTEADKKGGHLAVRKEDGQLVTEGGRTVPGGRYR